MKYFKLNAAGAVEEYAGNPKLNTTMLAAGWLPYAGTLPMSRLDIVDGEVEELPAPTPTEQWVDKMLFLWAVDALVDQETYQEINADPEKRRQLDLGLAQLPPDQVDLMDSRIAAFAALMGIDIALFAETIEAMLNPPQTTAKHTKKP